MEEASAQEEQSGGGMEKAAQLAQQVGDGLTQLSELLNASQNTTDEDRQTMAMVMDGFMKLVQSKLGGGEPEAEEAAPQAPVPANAGTKGVPMGPNTRM